MEKYKFEPEKETPIEELKRDAILKFRDHFKTDSVAIKKGKPKTKNQLEIEKKRQIDAARSLINAK